MKIKDIKVGDKLHIEDDLLFGFHGRIEVLEVFDDSIIALNYRKKKVIIPCDDLGKYLPVE